MTDYSRHIEMLIEVSTMNRENTAKLIGCVEKLANAMKALTLRVKALESVRAGDDQSLADSVPVSE